MLANFDKNNMRYPIYAFVIGMAILMAITTYFKWYLGISGFLLLGVFIYFSLKAEKKINEQLENYLSTLSYRVKRVGEEALLEMPIGIILFNDELLIEWANPYISNCFNEDTIIGRSLYDIADQVVSMIMQESEQEHILIHSRRYKVVVKREDKLLYFFDVTEHKELEKQYVQERTVLGIIFLDNYDEVTQGMDDQIKSNLNSNVTAILNNWAVENGLFLKRTSSDRFIAILNEHILSLIEKGNFAILDKVRGQILKQNVPLTLSIGIGAGATSLLELGDLAQSSLDLVLGRGGDQAAIKKPSGKVKFYGGKTNPVEKRTRVRARVISHALKNLITDSQNVIVMGHKNPDMDAIGASIGILKVALANQKDGFIVLNKNNLDFGVQRLIEEVKKKEELWSRFISPEDALEIITDETLLVVVDTHKPSLVIEEKLLNKTENIMVIDHHRRGEEFIEDPILVYMEPYASSTCELVTELLEYQPKTMKIDMLESTALLAGIIVDTKSFTLRTGARTFDAASYLRARGADTILVQKFLKEDLESFIQRAKIMETTIIYKNEIAIAKADPTDIIDQVLIAKIADQLLSMDGVQASFVIAVRNDHLIGISARSLGAINVQVIMEELDGGGHLTNAATQLHDSTVDEAEMKLIESIDKYLEGGNKL